MLRTKPKRGRARHMRAVQRRAAQRLALGMIELQKFHAATAFQRPRGDVSTETRTDAPQKINLPRRGGVWSQPVSGCDRGTPTSSKFGTPLIPFVTPGSYRDLLLYAATYALTVDVTRQMMLQFRRGLVRSQSTLVSSTSSSSWRRQNHRLGQQTRRGTNDKTHARPSVLGRLDIWTHLDATRLKRNSVTSRSVRVRSFNSSKARSPVRSVRKAPMFWRHLSSHKNHSQRLNRLIKLGSAHVQRSGMRLLNVCDHTLFQRFHRLFVDHLCGLCGALRISSITMCMTLIGRDIFGATL